MKRFIAGLAMIILVLGLVACGAPSAPAPSPIPAPAPPSGFFDGGVAPPPVINIPPPAPEPSPAPSPTPSVGLGQSPDIERMIVRTGYIDLVVVDVASAIERITGLSRGYNGYVVSSNSWREGDRLVGSITIRVDAVRFDDTIRALRDLAVEVNSESTTSKDVTEEYVDLSAKLHNLEASEQQLLRLMEQAGKVTEILEVQRELSRTRGEIEQTKGRMQYLEQTSATSLIEIRLNQAELGVTFSASSRTVKEGQNVYFTPRISGGISPYSYEWDFGDGSTSTDVGPAHSYKSQGSYNVSLKVTDDRGQTSSQERSNYIDILPGWSAGNIAGSAWSGLVTFGHAVVGIIIWLGVFSPVWIVIGAIVYFVWQRRRKKA